MTDAQTAALVKLKSGPQNIPIIYLSKFAAAGLVEKTGEPSGMRGYVNVRLTDAGRAAA